MNDAPVTSALAAPASDVPPAPNLAQRTVALVEVLLCSGYPTQLALSAALIQLGLRPQDPEGGLSLGFVVVVSLTDTMVLIGLILAILRSHGERPLDVFFGGRPVRAEARAGIPLTFVAFGIAVIVLGVVRAIAPWLRTVEHNPLQDLMTTPASAALFAVVVVVAGGVREELQRAFLLRRFETWLGGRTTGLIVASTAFGLGHIVQGADAVLATALLGAFWGVVYFQRRSVVAPMVSHAGFDLLQVAQFLTLGR